MSVPYSYYYILFIYAQPFHIMAAPLC